MPVQVLKRGDRGDEVSQLQSRLNRTGAMLKPDGDFGLATEKGVTHAQDIAGQPLTGIADASLLTWLETVPEPYPQLDTDGLAFIALEETGGLSYYEQYTRWPQFPGEASGITIGVGYDLRWNSAGDFLSLWSEHLPQIMLSELLKDIGKPGSTERTRMLRQLGIEVPFKKAWPVFIKKTIPRFYNETLAIYPSLEHLPGLCRCALVSIVYNRGNSLEGDRRREMRAIRAILAAADNEHPDRTKMKSILFGVEDQIISMKRLWVPSSGLVKRRQEEANLWRSGLAQW
jgi:hypothetical protein